MRGVGVGADGLADHMHLPVGGLALRHQRVQRPRGRPHDVAARLVVGRVRHRRAARPHERAHEALHDIVRRAVVGSREVLLHEMRHDVEDTGDHLVLRHRVGELGVQDGEAREHLGAGEHVPDLQLAVVVRDHRAAVHLAARARHREDAAHRHDAALGLLHAQVVLLPRILLAVRRHAHGLRVVHHRAAAHGQDEVHVVVARDGRALAQLLHGGVGHHARVLEHLLAGLAQDGHHPVVQAGLLDGAAAVGQLHARAVLGQLGGQAVQRVLAEDELRGVVVGEVALHGFAPFDAVRPAPRILRFPAPSAALPSSQRAWRRPSFPQQALTPPRMPRTA